MQQKIQISEIGFVRMLSIISTTCLWELSISKKLVWMFLFEASRENSLLKRKIHGRGTKTKSSARAGKFRMKYI